MVKETGSSCMAEESISTTAMQGFMLTDITAIEKCSANILTMLVDL